MNTKNKTPLAPLIKGGQNNLPLTRGINGVFGFTLTELIVTISILAILGAISIISIQNFYGNARDGVRISDIKSIHQWLTLLQIKAETYILPENFIEVQAGSEVLSYQGYIWDNTTRAIGVSKNPLDPKDMTRYTYTVDKSKKKAQLMGYLESGDTLKITAYDDFFQSLINESYATTNTIDYTSRFVYVTGDKIGVLTDENNAPIQESITGTGIDLNTTDTTGYVAYFWWNTYGAGESTGSGDILITQIQGAITDTIPCSNPITYSGYTITALSDNETKTFTKPLTIDQGTGTGSLQIQCLNGVFDTLHAIETLNVGCNTGYVNTGDNMCVLDICGGTPPVSSHSTATSQTITQNWTQNPIPGICTFDCDTNYTYNLGTNTCNANTQTALACNGSIKPSSHDNSTATTWTQTWDGTAWSPVYTYTRNPTPNICTYDCDTGHSWDDINQICTLNSYTVSGSFGANANGATISVCGSNVTADASGNFTTSRSYGTVCNNITATRANYTCVTTTNGPASLTSNFTTVAGSCTPNNYTVTFNTNGGWVPSPTTKSVTYNTAVGALATVARAGYTFNGWFTATSGGTAITTATVVTADVAWYAQWGQNGSCNNTINFACAAGTSVSNVAGSCGGSATWSCNGLNGGVNAACSKANVACTCAVPWGWTQNVGQTITAWNYSSPTSPTMCWSEIRTCQSNGTYNGSYVNQTCTQLYRQCVGTLWWTVAHGYSNTAYASSNPTYPTTCASQTRTCSDGTFSGTYGYTSCTQGYTYAWSSGSWGICSLSCGSWTQSRTVTCLRNDGATVADALCWWWKPAISQSCNTQACPVNGSCNNTVNFACAAGTSVSNVAGSCGGSATWGCNGLNGGTNAACSKANVACPVNCSYTTYEWWSCSSMCGNRDTYYHITVAASGGGTCPVSEGQWAGWNGSACTSAPYWQSCQTSYATNYMAYNLLQIYASEQCLSPGNPDYWQNWCSWYGNWYGECNCGYNVYYYGTYQCNGSCQ